MGFYEGRVKKICSLFALSLCLTSSPVPANASVPASCPPFENIASSQALDRRVAAGDSGAAFCLAAGLRSLDGGELEDALVALGRYGDRKPSQLLLLAHRGVLTRWSLARAVRMLPLSLTDDLERQVRVLKGRRDRLRKLAQPALRAERELALHSIESALREIRVHTANH